MALLKKFSLSKTTKSFLPKTLFARSLLVIIVPIITVEIVLSIYFYEKHWETITERLAKFFSTEVSYVIKGKDEIAKNVDWDEYTKSVSKNLIADFSFQKGQKLSPNIGYKPSSKLERIIFKKLHRYLDHPFVINFWDLKQKIQIKIELPEGVLEVVVLRKYLFSSTNYVIAIWMVAVTALFLTISILIMKNQIRPLKRLSEAMNKFGKGEHVPKFRPQGSSELRQAGYVFNIMRERLYRQMTQRTEMLAGISHDLRTPLTRMALQVEMLPDGDDKQELKENISDMKKMIDEYLDFARADMKEKIDHINIIDIIRKIIQNDTSKVKINYAQDLFLKVKPIAFQRAMENIISNALKYGKNAEISFLFHSRYLEIFIDDDGPGIDKENYEAVFKPFFRIDHSRNADTGGVGLGLALTKDIILSHGGNIKLKPSRMGGLRVEVILPL